MAKLYLELGSINNPERGETDKYIKPSIVIVGNFEDASKTVRAFIEENDLGASNFTGGEVTDINGKKLGHISYNGRIWLD